MDSYLHSQAVSQFKVLLELSSPLFTSYLFFQFFFFFLSFSSLPFFFFFSSLLEPNKKLEFLIKFIQVSSFSLPAIGINKPKYNIHLDSCDNFEPVMFQIVKCYSSCIGLCVFFYN